MLNARVDDGKAEGSTVNEEQLNEMGSRRGFIAALDQSGGSTPKALALYGIPENAYGNEGRCSTSCMRRARG